MQKCSMLTNPGGLLTFEGEARMYGKFYAGTRCTLSNRKLLRGCTHVRIWEELPGGYMKFYNIELLLQSIHEVGDDPSWNGRLRNIRTSILIKGRRQKEAGAFRGHCPISRKPSRISMTSEHRWISPKVHRIERSKIGTADYVPQ